MPRIELDLPEKQKEILQSIDAQFVCPVCDGNNRKPGNAFVRLCDFCSWDGSVSFATLLAYGASKKYVKRLFAMIRSAIDSESDEGFQDARALLLLVNASRVASTEKKIEEDNPFLADETLQSLGSVLDEFLRRRKSVFDQELEAAKDATLRWTPFVGQSGALFKV